MKKLFVKYTDEILQPKNFIELETDKVLKYTFGFEDVIYVNKNRTDFRYFGQDVLKEEDFKDWRWADKDYFIEAAKEFIQDEDPYTIDIYDLIDIYETEPQLTDEVEKDLQEIDFDMTGFEKYYPGYNLKMEDADNQWFEEDFLINDLEVIEEWKNSWNIPIYTLFKKDDKENILVMWNNMEFHYDQMIEVPNNLVNLDETIEYLQTKNIYV